MFTCYCKVSIFLAFGKATESDRDDTSLGIPVLVDVSAGLVTFGGLQAG
jgi:hypothetical protein